MEEEKKLSIKVAVGGRSYPLIIKAKDEENVRKAGKLIDNRLKTLQEKYAIQDKQDLLSMAALQLAIEKLGSETTQTPADLETALLEEINSSLITSLT